jgi:2-(1,2-epoxy-1,2-dihydrophenyl)acetyl-CoA isomerase
MTFANFEKSGRIATVTLNRAESRNAIATLEDCQDLVAAFTRASDDPEIVALVLTGAGQAFCSGGDLKAIREGTGIGPRKPAVETRANYRRGVQSVMRALADMEIATIAAINGSAIGLGLDIAAICDMRVMGASVKVASSFVKVGLVPGDGGAWVLTQLLGPARAAEMVLTGDQIGAEEALRLGLINKIAADGAVLADAHALAERVAVNPPRAVRMSKRLLRQAREGTYADVLELSSAFQALAHETADHKEAVNAFVEKRAPRFTGE